MTKVTLHKVARSRGPDKKPRHVWMLRWYGTDGTRYGETLGGTERYIRKDGEQ